MDSDAFQRLLHGDEQDIRVLYHAYRAAFIRFITDAFKCAPGRADEMYPEAFGIIYFNIRNLKLTLPLRSSIQTYLNSTGWNLYHRRYLDKYNREKLAIEHAQQALDTNAMVDEALIQKERSVKVKSLLESIGDPCKTILTQIYFQEASYKDLSLQMDIPEPTLRKRKFDCLGKMRKLFEVHNIDV